MKLSQEEKHNVVRRYASKYKIDTFVETGTFKGNMVNAVIDLFDSIYTIELDAGLYKRAKQRFVNHDNVFVFNGDSGKVLKDIVKIIDKPVIFWLDAHYSGKGTSIGEFVSPIIQELDSIYFNFSEKKIILIDDVRLFQDGTFSPDLSTLIKYVKALDDGCDIEIKNDIIRIVCSQNV